MGTTRRMQIPVIPVIRKAETTDAAAESSEETPVEKRLVWAEVYAPNRPDADGEFMNAEDIEGLAYRFMVDGDIHRFDIQHDGVVQKGIYLVESFIAREGDPDFIAGAWVVAMYVDDLTVWDRIKKGELNGFSVQALVVKETTDVLVDIPEIVTGQTSKAADGHLHTFAVKYDKDGKFMGGTTNTVKGHFHRIVAGTITQRANAHTHRFSAVDTVTVEEA